MINTDLLRLIPDGATHCLIEERLHRGEAVYSVTAVVPNGAAIPLNAYSSEELARSTADAINAHLEAAA